MPDHPNQKVWTPLGDACHHLQQAQLHLLRAIQEAGHLPLIKDSIRNRALTNGHEIGQIQAIRYGLGEPLESLSRPERSEPPCLS